MANYNNFWSVLFFDIDKLNMSDIDDNISESSDTCHIPDAAAAGPPKDKKIKKNKKPNHEDDIM